MHYMGNLDYNQAQSQVRQKTGTGYITVHPGCLRLHNRIYGQDIWGTTWLCNAEEDGYTKKVDYGLTCIGHLVLWNRNICPGGVTLCVTV